MAFAPSQAMRGTPFIKGRPFDDDAIEEPPVPLASHSSIVPPVLRSASGRGVLSSNDYNEEDCADEVIREIDVYLSPSLASSMCLVQFPLQPATAFHRAPSSKQNAFAAHLRPKLPPLPHGARVRPRHSMLELDYPIEQPSQQQRQVPEALNLTHRTFVSTNVPIVTHMALGLLDPTGTRMDLVPLQKVLQMRPSFAHVDALYHDDDLDQQIEAQEIATAKQQQQQQPLLFKKKESDRAVLARRSSYAYKLAIEEEEEWVELQVHGYGSAERREAIKEFTAGSTDFRTVALKLDSSQNQNTSRTYVKSLNYLQNACLEEEDFVIPDPNEEADNDTIIDADGNEVVLKVEDRNQERTDVVTWKRDFVAKITFLFQKKGGVPIPYPVLRSRFPETVPDDVLMEALSSCAVLVRGNFVLKSTLLIGLSRPAVRARDLILLLFHKHGRIERETLFHVYDSLYSSSEEDGAIITSDVINSILGMVARTAENSMEMKLADDVSFGVDFEEHARSHRAYWDRKEKQLSKLVRMYEEQLEDRGLCQW